ncbi:MAG: HlyD family efflux transporter periplasmic adaptor subunit [Caldilineaceae bacterium]|nr:HlyD family efflux transporter periplasmic adaptor subunit [Caldilineaceae bacterium]
MKRILVVLAALIVLAGGWWAYANFMSPVIAEQAQNDGPTTLSEADAPADDLENVIWASGKLVPVTWASLSPMQGGTVTKINVSVGDWVQEGDVLLEVQNGMLTSQVEMAAAALDEAKAAHDKLMSGAGAADLAAAQAQLSAANASVALAQGRLLEAQSAVALARSELTIAQQQYNELASHPTQAEIAAAQAEVDIAQAAVTQAQASYNLVRGDPNIGSRPESLALQQATETLKAAQARYTLSTQGASQQELAVASAQIEAARARVTVAESQIPAAEAAVASAQAGVDSAQAALDKLNEGATESEIAMSQARVRSALASLVSAQVQLGQTQVIAPFAGQIGSVDIHLGELAAGGQPLILLGDTNTMQIETTDLRETDVARLDPGLPVEVTFDALPNRTFSGEIVRIAPVSTTDKGSTNYTVTVDVAELDEHLRWGMTAFTNISVK